MLNQFTSALLEFTKRFLLYPIKSKVVAKATLAAIEDVQDALIFSKVPGEKPTVIQSPALTLTSQRQARDSLGKVAIGVTGEQNSGFILPETAGLASYLPANYTDAIDTQVYN